MLMSHVEILFWFWCCSFTPRSRLHVFLQTTRCPCKSTLKKANLMSVPFSIFFKLEALFNAAFVEDFCFYTFRTEAYMSHQSVSEPSFSCLRKIMSGGTWGICLGKQPLPSCSLLLHHFSAIQWQTLQD